MGGFGVSVMGLQRLMYEHPFAFYNRCKYNNYSFGCSLVPENKMVKGRTVNDKTIVVAQREKRESGCRGFYGGVL